MRFQQQQTAQVEAFRMINRPALEAIDMYAKEFREIINGCEAEFGFTPSAEDLIWIASEHAGKDITKGD